MKTSTTVIRSLLALTIAFSILSCGKDKKDPTPAPPVEVKAIAIADLKALSITASVKIPDGKKISGIVISDATGKNIDSKMIVLQEASDKPGILVSFDAAPAFAAGDQVEVNVSNQTLTQANGEIILTNIPAANAKKTGTGSITARATTAAAIATNKTAWDGTLVTLPAGAFSGGNGKFTDTLTYTDSSGMIKSVVLASAAFANTDYTTAIDNITGIVRVNSNDVHIDIRSTADVVSGVKYTFTEDFSTVTVQKYNNTDNPCCYVTPNGIYALSNLFNNYLSPLANDAFLVQSRKYVYLVMHDDGFQSNISTGTVNLSGLKTVSVTFGGSNYIGKILITSPDDHSTEATVDVSPFDPAKHTIGITLYASSDDWGNFPIGYAQYNEVGKLFTANFKFPQTVAEFVNLLTKSTDPNWSGLSTDDMKAAAGSFLAQPKIVISNHSTNRITGKDDYLPNNDGTPVVIDKIVFGFEKKPE
jgi:hypothetical protein